MDVYCQHTILEIGIGRIESVMNPILWLVFWSYSKCVILFSF